MNLFAGNEPIDGIEPVVAPAARETERTMLDRLNVRYGKFNGNGIQFTRAEHVKISAGFDARRICDYMAINLWPGMGRGSGPTLHGHEVKVSRADWLTELRDPEKAEAFRQFCDYWWLVVSDKAIVRPGELPKGWGLMVAHGKSVRVATPASLNEAVVPMPRHVQATLTRAVTKTTLRLAADDRAMQFLAGRMNIPVPVTPDIATPDATDISEHLDTARKVGGPA